MKVFYKNNLALLMLASVLALSGCGKKKNNGGPGPGPSPQSQLPPPNPNNTAWNNTNGGYFNSYFAMYQTAYGNIVIPVGPVNTGWVQIPAGTYSWAQFYSQYITGGAQSCVNNSYNGSCGNSNGQWGQFNYGYFYQQYSGQWSYNNQAIYLSGGSATQGGTMNITLSQLMNAFYGSISNTYTSGYYGSYNSGYYYPSNYQSYCNSCQNSNYYGGNYYNTGSGWNLSVGIGGHF